MEESAYETRRVEAATSPSVGNPPQTYVCQEAARGEDEEAEEAGRFAAEKVVPLERMETPPVSLSSPPLENPGQELSPAVRDPVLPEASRTEQEEAGREASTGLAEELHATQRSRPR